MISNTSYDKMIRIIGRRWRPMSHNSARRIVLMRKLAWGSLVLLAVVWTSGCGGENKAVKRNDPTVKAHAPDALTIGKVAPDIVGEDIDGKEFKLSDYRGKVVVLDF